MSVFFMDSDPQVVNLGIYRAKICIWVKEASTRFEVFSMHSKRVNENATINFRCQKSLKIDQNH